ncbi:MAG: hypothetical protein ACXVJN_09020 [Mucilaginibacter sp.]
MVKITHGKTTSLTDIAENHWQSLNPTKEDGKYAQRALISRVNVLYKHHFSYDVKKADFYLELIRDNYKLLHKLVVCPPAEMKGMIADVESLLQKQGLSGKTANDKFFGYELLNEVFQYNNWRSGPASAELFRSLGVEICPYCNTTAVFRDETRQITVVSFDHFFDKATYPYLGLSFFNLIPSCKTCNETYKNQHQFDTDTHLHPYLDCYNEFNTFTHDYHADASECKIYIDNDPLDSRSNHFNADLGLPDRYNIPYVKKLARLSFSRSLRYSADQKRNLVLDWGLANEDEVEKKICEVEDIPFKETEIASDLFGKAKRDFAFNSHLISRDNPLL